MSAAAAPRARAVVRNGEQLRTGHRAHERHRREHTLREELDIEAKLPQVRSFTAASLAVSKIGARQCEPGVVQRAGGARVARAATILPLP